MRGGKCECGDDARRIGTVTDDDRLDVTGDRSFALTIAAMRDAFKGAFDDA